MSSAEPESGFEVETRGGGRAPHLLLHAGPATWPVSWVLARSDPADVDLQHCLQGVEFVIVKPKSVKGLLAFPPFSFPSLLREAVQMVGKKLDFGAKLPDLKPTPALTSCLILGKLFNFSVTEFIHL